jgi:hypothetical protein
VKDAMFSLNLQLYSHAIIVSRLIDSLLSLVEKLVFFIEIFNLKNPI